jgi:hypothetical protein
MRSHVVLIVSILVLSYALSASISVPAFSQTASQQSTKPLPNGKKAPCSKNRNVACY